MLGATLLEYIVRDLQVVELGDVPYVCGTNLYRLLRSVNLEKKRLPCSRNLLRATERLPVDAS